MTGSFLFVKPSDGKGEPGTAYSDPTRPRYPYDLASWEWLLERVLRRNLILDALDTPHSKDVLAGNEDQYSMHRWPAYTEYWWPVQSSISPYQHRTDANFGAEQMIPVPTGWDTTRQALSYTTNIRLVYGYRDLVRKVEDLLILYYYGRFTPFDWLHPDWSPSDLSAWDISASLQEVTKGTMPTNDPATSIQWKWKTSVNPTPYTIPNDAPFKCLTHMRTDDPTKRITIENDDNQTIEIETAETPTSATRDTDGSIVTYSGTQVRAKWAGAAWGSWTLEDFYILYKPNADLSAGEGGSAFDRDNHVVAFNYIGYLVNAPDIGSGYIAVDKTDKGIGFAHEVDWDGKPTWWHANGFPKGLDSVLSPKLKAQLKALCPLCQPALPPNIPALYNGFPDPGSLPWHHDTSFSFNKFNMPEWMMHIGLAATPVNMAAWLDAMTTTVHKVEHIFVKYTSKEIRNTEYKDRYRDSNGHTSDTGGSKYTTTTEEGSRLSMPLPVNISVSEADSTTYNYYTNSTTVRPPDYSNTFTSQQSLYNSEEEGFTANCDFIICLRATDNTSVSHKTTKRSVSKSYGHISDTGDAETQETTSGKLPVSYDPDPNDLLFPDWVLPWIEKAELFAYIESRLHKSNDTEGTSTNTTYKQKTVYPRSGQPTITYQRKGEGQGSRTHKIHRKFVSLGEMDKLTGRFPSVNVSNIIAEVDPDPSFSTSISVSSTEITFTTSTKTNDGQQTDTVDTNTSELITNGSYGGRVRDVSYYVVVTWKFDRTDPESFKADVSPLTELYRKLADAQMALEAAQRELADARASLSAAETEQQNANTELEQALARKNDPDSAKTELIDEAQAKLDEAQNKLDEALSSFNEAQSAATSAKEARDSAENEAAEAQAAYDEAAEAARAAAIESDERIEEAQTALDEASTAYNEAAGTYNDAQAEANDAQTAFNEAQTAFDDAQDSFDEAHTALDSAQENTATAKSALTAAEETKNAAAQALLDAIAAKQAAIDAGEGIEEAQAAIDAAQISLAAANRALDEAEDNLANAYHEESSAQSALDAAQSAVDDAQSSLDTAQENKDTAQAALTAAEEAMRTAENEVSRAQEAYNAAVETAVSENEEVGAAQATLDSATAAYDAATEEYNNAFSRLTDAQFALDDAQTVLDDAQERYDTLQGDIEELLQKAVDDARAAYAAATANVEKFTQEVTKAEAEVSKLETEVDEAKTAIIEAGGTLPSSSQTAPAET